MNLNGTLIIEVVSFLILLGLLSRLFYRPLLKILDKRAEEIKQANQKVQENLSYAEKEHTRAEQILNESKLQALKIKEKVSQDAEVARQKGIKQAKEQAEKILRTCQQEIASEAKRAKEEIKEEIINLSLQEAEQILRRKFTVKEQRQLIKELTEGIG